MVSFKYLLFATLFLVHGTNANCDGTEANNLIVQMDHFNNMLSNYASLGSSLKKAPAATAAHNHVAARAIQGETVSPSEPTHIHHSHPESSYQTISVDSSKKQEKHTQTNPLHEHIKESYKALAKQQTHLDSLASACIPNSHKVKVVSAFSKMISIYLNEEANIKAAGKFVSKPKKSDKNKAEPKQKRNGPEPTAGWMTMHDDVNGGYNNQLSILMEEPSITTIANSNISPLAEYGYSAPEPYMGEVPRYKAEFVTITTTQQPTPTPAPESTVSADADSASDSDSGSDDDNSSSDDNDDDTTSAATGAVAPTTTSKKKNIITQAIDGTFHLVMGTVHFAEHLLGFGNNKASNTIGGNNEELDKMINNLARIYNIKL